MNELEQFFKVSVDQISTEQLKQLLSFSLPTDSDNDAELISAAIEELSRRKGQDSVSPPIDVDRAWEEFQEYHRHPSE